jgi:hypothetical protein
MATDRATPDGTPQARGCQISWIGEGSEAAL